MPTNDFTPLQHQVLWSLAEGQTLSAAAAAAGVHRNTVLNWRRGDTKFRATLDSIHYEQAMHWREQCLPLAPLALNAIREILENPDTKPALRLRVALAIHKIVSTPPARQSRETPLDWDFVYRMSGTVPPLPHREPVAPVRRPEIIEHHAQSCTIPADPEPGPELVNHPAPAAPKPEIVHNSAQSTHAGSAKPGRNAPCPCSSGRKFKHCCLGKQVAA